MYNKEEKVYIKNNDSNILNLQKKSNVKMGIDKLGSQGSAQAMNLRDTINKLNLNIPIKAGLRKEVIQ